MPRYDVSGTPGFRPPVAPLPLRAGTYVPPGEVNGSAVALTQSLLYAVPVVFDRAGTLTSLTANCTVVAASSTIRAGLYADAGSCHPGALLGDFGTVDTAVGTGLKTWTISQAVEAMRLYWLASVCQGGTPTLTVTARVFFGLPTPAAATMTAIVRGYQQASVTGGLPSTFTATKTPITGFCPHVVIGS